MDYNSIPKTKLSFCSKSYPYKMTMHSLQMLNTFWDDNINTILWSCHNDTTKRSKDMKQVHLICHSSILVQFLFNIS